MKPSSRISIDLKVMGGAPCIRGMRVTVGMIVGLIRTGTTADEILDDYPYLDAEDIAAAIEYDTGQTLYHFKRDH